MTNDFAKLPDKLMWWYSSDGRRSFSGQYPVDTWTGQPNALSNERSLFVEGCRCWGCNGYFLRCSGERQTRA